MSRSCVLVPPHIQGAIGETALQNTPRRSLKWTQSVFQKEPHKRRYFILFWSCLPRKLTEKRWCLYILIFFKMNIYIYIIYAYITNFSNPDQKFATPDLLSYMRCLWIRRQVQALSRCPPPDGSIDWPHDAACIGLAEELGCHPHTKKWLSLCKWYSKVPKCISVSICLKCLNSWTTWYRRIKNMYQGSCWKPWWTPMDSRLYSPYRRIHGSSWFHWLLKILMDVGMGGGVDGCALILKGILWICTKL